MTIGGVFLRLFIANPGWVLRKPREFIVELLERWSALVSTQSPDVSLPSTNLSNLITFVAQWKSHEREETGIKRKTPQVRTRSLALMPSNSDAKGPAKV